MRFNLVDRIVSVEPGRRILVEKHLTLAEEYLADHFPTFPVMPGVLMLQTLVEASAWLVRLTENFRHSVIVLREAKNVKYGHFVEPGKTLVVICEWADSPDGPSEGLVTFKGKGEVDGNPTVSARLSLLRYNLRDRNPLWREADERIVSHLRSQYALLTQTLASTAGERGLSRP
jgi:3-hydroxyacyl-[acyl-carrier-protein] dehydratase